MHSPERRALQDTLTAIRHRCTLAAAGHRLFPNGERHLRSCEQLARIYPQELLDETLQVAERCEFSLNELRYQYPRELVPHGMEASQHLRNLTEAGLKVRWPKGVPEKIRAVVEKELALIVEERRIENGRDLFREGDPGDAVYLIVKGSVQVIMGGSDGKPERVLNELGPGACIGEMAVLDASPRSATVRSTDRTRTLRVPGEGFKRVMSERPEMSQAIVAELVKRMRDMMSGAPVPKLSSAAIQLPKEE